MSYLIVKTLHLLFVISWMAAAFYLPRILVNMSEAAGEAAVQARLKLMALRLYRFGHTLFGIAFVLGLVLWLYFGISGGWLHAKLLLVGLLLAHFIVAGRWAKGDPAKLPSPKALRWFNEIPVLLLLAVIWLVLAKPF